MTAISVSDCTVYKGFVGELKFMMLVLPATADTDHTIDLHTDSAGGFINEIHNTLIQDDLGQDEECTWVPGTGVITLGTITATGIHNLLVVGT